MGFCRAMWDWLSAQRRNQDVVLVIWGNLIVGFEGRLNALRTTPKTAPRNVRPSPSSRRSELRAASAQHLAQLIQRSHRHVAHAAAEIFGRRRDRSTWIARGRLARSEAESVSKHHDDLGKRHRPDFTRPQQRKQHQRQGVKLPGVGAADQPTCGGGACSSGDCG